MRLGLSNGLSSSSDLVRHFQVMQIQRPRGIFQNQNCDLVSVMVCHLPAIWSVIFRSCKLSAPETRVIIDWSTMTMQLLMNWSNRARTVTHGIRTHMVLDCWCWWCGLLDREDLITLIPITDRSNITCPPATLCMSTVNVC